ncbi:unnamed protein product [Linum tenue]|uniref:Zinc finger protein CONSTANS-LIKE 16 n=1 Tax=Linum tenue TaxID=586396 RepID=A0AAV0NL08_9ROSI|nr:unnamed protein product [Linum tenue]
MNKSHTQQQVAAAASAYGGKTARACDSCIRRRARWYCAADDAFLCQSCDASVHSANPLARRHERLRLKTASLKSLSLPSSDDGSNSLLLQQPAWHRGFTRKPRTPRANGTAKTTSSPSVSKSNHFEETLTMMRVPEVGCDEHDEEAAAAAEEEEEHQLLYRVPILDPLELCNADESFLHHHQHTAVSASSSGGGGGGGDSSNQEESLLQMQGLVLPSDMELAEFAADVESLLGRGLEAESFGMEELGILDCSNHHNDNNKDDDDGDVSKLVKMETGEFLGGGGGGGVDEYSDEQPLFQLSFDYGGDEEAATCQEEEDEKMVMRLAAGADEVGDNMEIGKKRKRNILLRLNYEAVMAAWDTSTQGSTSPWTNGRRPEFDVNECWPDCMGGCGREYLHHRNQHHHLLGYQLGEERSLGAAAATAGDGGREARVSRYREKRRTRLFSKKIRYEVRKLNAEKRPRMKGRFVKRASFAAAGSSTTAVPNYTSLVLNNKK